MNLLDYRNLESRKEYTFSDCTKKKKKDVVLTLFPTQVTFSVVVHVPVFFLALSVRTKVFNFEPPQKQSHICPRIRTVKIQNVYI